MALFARTTARNAATKPRLFITDTALNKFWEPLKVPAYQDPSLALQKRVAELGKKSGLEVREGDAYEGKGALFPNPFKVVDLDAQSVYGHLNNLTDADMERVKNDNAIGQKALKAKFGEKITATQRASFYEKNPEYSPINVEFLEKGRATLKKIMKNGGHFNKAHFASVELRYGDARAWRIGKGTNFIDPDYIACEPPRAGKRGRWVIVELKKGWGKTNTASAAAEAQQLRKAAALVRKWSFEIWGQVPIVELYFAAGEASDFGPMYEFTREGGVAINNKLPSNSNMRNANGKVIPKYTAIPIHLLTGKGFADFIRVEPVLLSKITGMQSKAYAQWPFARAAEYLDEKYGTAPQFRSLSLTKDADFMRAIPAHWVPRNFKGELGHMPEGKKANLKFNYNATVRKVGKLLGYVKARKMNIKDPAKLKKDQYKKEALQISKALLARYRPILSPSLIQKLESNRNKWAKEVQVPTNKTPNMGPKFLSKILRRRLDFKVERGKPARLRNVEFTAASIAPKNIVRENVWKMGKAAPVLVPGPRMTPSPPAKLTNANLQTRITALVFQAGTAYERRQWANLAAIKKTASPLLRNAMSRRPIRNFTLQARAAMLNLQPNQNRSPPKAAPKPKPVANANKQLIKKAYEKQFGNKFDLRKMGAYEKKTGKSVINLAQSLRAGTPLNVR